MHIVRATVEDAEEILALQKLAFRTEAEFYDEWSIPPLLETVEQLRDCFARHTVMKAVAGAAIVGAVRASEDGGVCHVERLVVHPDQRRKGIASALVEAIEAEFPEAARFELETGARSEGNLRLYRQLGCVSVAESVESPNVTLVHMIKGGTASAQDRRGTENE